MIIYFLKLYNVFVSFLSFCIRFPNAEFYISGLQFAHTLVEKNFVDPLITYIMKFTSTKNLSDAAKIVNVQEGLTSVLAIFTCHIARAYFGLFKIIIVNNVLFFIGMVMFYIAAYADGIMDKKIPYLAVFLIAVGISGRDILLGTFLSDQRECPIGTTVNVEDEVLNRSSLKAYGKLMLYAVVSAVMWYTIQDIRTLVVLAMAAVVIGLLCFLLCHSFYRKRPPTAGPLTTVSRVFKAAILKRHRKYPTKLNQFKGPKNALFPSISLFRLLDRAAILESSSIGKEELETNGRRLCTVAEVKEVKHLLTVIPIWTAFLVYSVVEAAGNTFFFEQSSSTDEQFPFIIFVICKDLAALISLDIGRKLHKFQFLKTRQRLASLVQIGIGMLCSLSCCIVAWRVEKFRLNTKMNVLWLTPQFILLGCMEGFAEEGLDIFFKTQVSGSMRAYGPFFNEFALGLGKFISATFIIVFKGWFGKDVESSHLQKYYKFLVWLSLINFFLFVSTAVWYGNDQGQVEMEKFLPTSILPNKSYTFPPSRSRLPKTSSFKSTERPVRRFLSCISGYWKGSVRLERR